MMIVKRILKSWIGTFSLDDYQLIDGYLNEAGKTLFFQMGKIDQFHSLAVAQTIIADSKREAQPSSHVIQAALLHDVGKMADDFNLLTRILVALIRRLVPIYRGKLAMAQLDRRFWGRVRYGCYIDLIHPVRGAHLTLRAGFDPAVAELIRRHHDPPRLNQNPDLTKLQTADDQN
ncbi:HDIG domain-containing metalloprotein [Hydrogenispora ethanolica]|nr:HDIG domain-containing metalloprotein [Hydrogenispora ethanolica]